MKSLLKFITCGSVDDGKSTLIGHLLYDAKLLYVDQKRALELDSKIGSREGKIDYSLLLDGLIAEREQGITIDVAYRYFTTDNRSFIVADTPGHEEYTRNMAVGASFANLAVILIDAEKGVLAQTRRHVRICALMGIKYFVFAVNKMDLVGYSQERFLEIERQIKSLKEELSLYNVKVIPVSATEGDNVAKKSENMPWYSDETILAYLENVDVDNDAEEEGFYMPIQRVCRPNYTFRGFQGQIESGTINLGDDVTILPSNEKASVKNILIGDKNAIKASKGQPVTIQLNKEVDVSRGCVLTNNTKISTSNSFTGTVLWMDNNHLLTNEEYILKIGTKMLPAIVTNIKYKIDVNTGEHLKASTLTKNEIAVCSIKMSEKIVIDKFNSHKTLGEFILIDRITNMTSACGVVESILNDDGLNEENVAFYYKDLKARGDIFEEFYYNTDSFSLSKYNPIENRYTLGDRIPVKGGSYEYPSDIDILVLRDWIAIKVRNAKITEINSIDEYSYGGVPVVNGRGFAVKASSNEGILKFLNEYKKIKNGSEESEAEFLSKWTDLGTYRRVIFHENYWEI